MTLLYNGVENDPIILDEEVEATHPCSLCLKESYIGPVCSGQRVLRGGKLSSSEGSKKRFEIHQRRALTMRRRSLRQLWAEHPIGTLLK